MYEDDDFDLDHDGEGEDKASDEPTPKRDASTFDPERLQREVEKLRREAKGLRVQLRRAEMTAEYGSDVVEMVPETLPIKEQRELADRLAQRLRTSEPTPTETLAEDEPVEALTEAEIRLAAVSSASNTVGASAGTGKLSVAEIKELGKTDPVRAGQLINQGRFRMSDPL